MKKNLYIRFILLFLIILSCETDNDNVGFDVPYYQFSDENASLIINYNYSENQIITYQNQYDEQLNFKVISNETKKNGYYTGTFSGGTSLINHYDSKIIRFEILENNDYEYYQGLVNYIFSKNSNNFKNGINIPLWNISSFTIIDEIQNPANILMTNFNSQERTQMTVNNHTFENVIMIESESDDEYLNSSYGTIPKKVNKVFYDYGFGLIRFDDIDGNQWELIYPE